MRSIAVFCGASSGNAPVFAEAARELGRRLAEAGISLVYGGGRVGQKGELADAGLAAGGEVVGVIPRDLRDREHDHPRATTMHDVDGKHER